MENEKSNLEEKFRAEEECHKAELERLRQSHKKTFKKFHEDTQKNLIKALPKCKSNLILHAQITTGPLDLKSVDFDCLKDIPTSSLNFDIYHLAGEDQETFSERMEAA